MATSETVETRPRRKRDPEIQAMDEIQQALEGLGQAAVKRVLAWVCERNGLGLDDWTEPAPITRTLDEALTDD